MKISEHLIFLTSYKTDIIIAQEKYSVKDPFIIYIHCCFIYKPRTPKLYSVYLLQISQNKINKTLCPACCPIFCHPCSLLYIPLKSPVTWKHTNLLHIINKLNSLSLNEQIRVSNCTNIQNLEVSISRSVIIIIYLSYMLVLCSCKWL